MLPEFKDSHAQPVVFHPAPLNAGHQLPGSSIAIAEKRSFKLRIERYVHRLFQLQFRVFQFFRPSYIKEEQTVDDLRMEAVFSGELPSVSSSGEEVAIKAGEYHLTNHAPLEQLFHKDSATRYIITHYSPELLEGEEIADRLKPTPVRKLTSGMWDILHKLLRNPNEEEDLRAFHYKNCVREFLELHLQDQEHPLPGELSSDEVRRIYAAESVLKQDLSVHIEVPALATMFGTNSARLTKGFQREFQMGVYERLTYLRMEFAKELLLNTHRTMDDIGTAVGYSGRNHFIAAFKKNFGITPRQWRLKRGQTE